MLNINLCQSFYQNKCPDTYYPNIFLQNNDENINFNIYPKFENKNSIILKNYSFVEQFCETNIEYLKKYSSEVYIGVCVSSDYVDFKIRTINYFTVNFNDAAGNSHDHLDMQCMLAIHLSQTVSHVLLSCKVHCTPDCWLSVACVFIF